MPVKKRKTRCRNERNAKKLQVPPKETPTGPDFINTLNDDCLARIFTYLPLQDRFAIQAVCQRWRHNSRLTWGDIKTLDLTQKDLLKYLANGTDASIKRMFERCGRFLHKLKIGPICRSTILQLVCDNCRYLTKLEVVFFWKNTQFPKWISQTVKLKYLIMKKRNQHFPDTFFRTLPHKHLTELHLTVDIWYDGDTSYLPRVTMSAFEKVTKLSVLTLKGFSLSPSILMMINEKLTCLSLENCIARRGMPQLDHLINLEYLNLSKISEISDEFIIRVTETCTNLKYLNLRQCTELTDTGIIELQSLSKLETLILSDIYNITDEPLSKMHNLKKLTCDWCYGVKDNGIITLIRYARNLEYLSVINSATTTRLLKEAANIIVARRTNTMALTIHVSFQMKLLWNQDNCPPLLNVCSSRDVQDDD